MPSGMRLKLLRSDLPGEAYAEYEVWQQNPGGPTVLKETLKLFVRDGQGAAVGVDVTGCNAPTPDEALDKAAEWLERLAEAIRNRDRKAPTLPIYPTM